jgi:hypothetical protein
MNLPHHLHLMTVRIRKSRRRAARFRRRSNLSAFLFCVWILAPTYLLPPWARAASIVAMGLAYVRASYLIDHARVYDRVVDRSHGAMLTILAVQRWQMDDEGLRRRGERASSGGGWS